MIRQQTLPGAIFIGVVVLYAVLSGVWTSSDPGWYAGLAKPSWQPPDWVFGIVWPLNFLALAGVGFALTRTPQTGRAWTALGVAVVSVAAALTWAYLFYVPHALSAAATALAIAAVLTWVLLAVCWRAVGPVALVLVIYAVWMSVASVLAQAYARLAA